MRRFGLIGRTLKHSFSKKYFAQKFAEESINDCVYSNYELTSIDELPSLLASDTSIAGLNVTIPYKEQCLQFLYGKNKIVEKTGACNCISISDGKLYGFNTDAVAFQKSLQKKLQPQHQ